jgi:hypothetical protein
VGVIFNVKNNAGLEVTARKKSNFRTRALKQAETAWRRPRNSGL